MKKRELVCFLALAALAGCAAQDSSVAEPVELAFDESGTSATKGPTTPMTPDEFTDTKGNHWRKKGRAAVAEPEDKDRGTAGPTDEEVAQWDDAEYAAHVRPVAYAEGYEYELVATDAEVLAKMRRAQEYLLAHPEVQEGREPVAPSSDLDTQQVIGTDGRVGIYTPTAFPYSPVGVMMNLPSGDWDLGHGEGGCTFTMIGASTAVTAAHCVYTSGVGWHAMKSWALGVRSSTSGSQVMDYGVYLGCTWITIPSGYVSSDSVYDDYAVIEFSNSQGPNCNLSPGSTTGWYGWINASYSQILDNPAYMRGYPKDIPAAYTSSYEYPTLFARSGPTGSVWFFAYPSMSVLSHTLDTTGGDSGAAIVQSLAGDQNRVVGIHRGSINAINWARKIDSTVSSFIYSNSAL